MYKIIDGNGNTYLPYEYASETEYERMIVKHADEIFGKTGIYFDVKRRIGTPGRGATIPDGYYLDLTFHTAPKLYLVEVEQSNHDVYGHIGEQILRFGISSETDKYKLKNLLLKEISQDIEKRNRLQAFFSESSYHNHNELLDKVIFDTKPAAIIIIDKAEEELHQVVEQLTMTIEVIEAQTYICGSKKIHRFSSFRDDIINDISDNTDVDELDTIVVPAREDGFKEEFLQNNRWFAIRMSGAMLDKIKYIAAYQVSPVSAITHIAEVERIERYQDTGKYILFFKQNSLAEISKISLGERKALAPQCPRYTSFHVIQSASTLDDLW